MNQSFNKYLPSYRPVLGTMFGVEETEMNEEDMVSVLNEFVILQIMCPEQGKLLGI